MRKIFVVAAISISSHLFAQVVPQDSSRLMSEVTLTASKFSIKTTETGKVVTVITRQEIEHAGSRDLAQVITELGGVFINGFNSNPGKEKNIYLRGAKVDYTLITIDGVPVYDASGIGSNFDIRNISIDNVERIEILKGSQSTLYGSDAIAGVINIITKKGGTKPFTVNGVADYGSFNTFKGNLNLSGSKSNLDYNIGYSHVNTDGFSEAKTPENSNEKFDKDGYEQNNINFNLGLQAGKNFRIQPFLRYTKFVGDLDQDAFTDEADFTNTNKNLQAGVQNILNVGKGQINIRYQFINTDRHYLDDSIKSRNGYYTFYEQSFKGQEHFAEAFLVHSFSSIKLTGGIDFRSSNTDYESLSVSPPFPPYALDPTTTKTVRGNDSTKQNQVGIYAALNYSLSGFSIEGGGRFNSHSEYGSNYAFNINPSYFFKNRIKIFGNFSSGYRTPSLYQLFSLYGNKELTPETSTNFEAGMHAFSNNEKSSLRVLYFNRDVKDVIAFISLPTYPYGGYVNQDKQKDHGIEVEASSKPSEKLQLKAIYSFVTGQIMTKQNGKDTTYFNLLRRPKSTFSFFVGSQLAKAFYANLQFSLIGERKDVYFAPPTYAQQDIILENYALLNFYIEYALLNNGLKIFADFRNILDKDYSDIYGYNTAGFNASGGIRFHF
jgi:vitamin B12 transporter